MARMHDLATTVDPLHLVRDLHPQSFGRSHPDRIREPLVEPAWSGLRVLAAAHAGQSILINDGEPVEEHEPIRVRLAGSLAATADGAVLDGYLTKQVVANAVGVYTGPEDLPSTGKMIAQTMVGVRRNRAEEAARRLEAETTARSFSPDDLVNFVVVDLLWLDGEWLLDIPLLERKRLLEAVLPGDDLIRPGPYVRPPLATWIGSWRAQGFAGLTFKSANSRYRPGEAAPDWTVTPMPTR
jgi:hypothetical protein